MAKKKKKQPPAADALPPRPSPPPLPTLPDPSFSEKRGAYDRDDRR